MPTQGTKAVPPASESDESFAERALRFFYPIHYRFGMEMENAMGQGLVGRKHAALLWLIYCEAGADGSLPRKIAEARLSSWFEMSNPNVTKIIKDVSSGERALVASRENPQSGREKLLQLTPEGEQFVRGMVSAAEKKIAEWVGHMPPGALDNGLAFMENAFGRAPREKK